MYPRYDMFGQVLACRMNTCIKTGQNLWISNFNSRPDGSDSMYVYIDDVCIYDAKSPIAKFYSLKITFGSVIRRTREMHLMF